jgi:tungstate transport system ATP-binding protein
MEGKDLRVTYGPQTVLDVPLVQVFPNEVLGIIGPNGSGKTTLLLCLTRLIKPTTGTLSYRGASVADKAAALKLHRSLAAVFQEPLLLNTSVWDNVTLGMRLRHLPKPEIKERAEKWLARFGVAALAKRQAKTLSSGEAKRTSLARAFALQPDVLFLDEPFTALDSPTRQALLEDFLGVLRETRVTTVMVTHDRNEALALASRVLVLMEGRIRQSGTPAEVFGFPVDETVAAFVEAGNVLNGVVAEQKQGLARVSINGHSLQAVSNLPTGAEVTAYLHYEDVTLSVVTGQAPPSSARNQLTGRIAKVFPYGSHSRVTIDCGLTLSAVITKQSWDDLGLAIGQEILASFKASSVRLVSRLGQARR